MHTWQVHRRSWDFLVIQSEGCLCQALITEALGLQTAEPVHAFLIFRTPGFTVTLLSFAPTQTGDDPVTHPWQLQNYLPGRMTVAAALQSVGAGAGVMIQRNPLGDGFEYGEAIHSVPPSAVQVFGPAVIFPCGVGSTSRQPLKEDPLPAAGDAQTD